MNGESFSKNKAVKAILITALLIIGTFFLFQGLVLAKSFLVPIVIAALLSMLLSPLESRLRRIGLNKGLAILLCDILLLAALIGLFALISAQVKNIIQDWPQLKPQIINTIDQARNFIADRTGFDVPSNEEILEKIKSRSGSGQAGAAAGAFLGTLTDTLLVFVYIFFFMYYRQHFKGFIIRLVNKKDEEEAREVISDSGKIAQQYLIGKLLLILFLAIIYSIGLLIVGVKYAIFIALLAAIFTLLPYIGNLIGGTLAVAMAIMGGGGVSAIIGVLIVFSITQFIESYILEPFVVGHKVDLNPVFTLIIIILGGAIWGIAGMIIAIPVLGILKVVFDHIPALHPFAYLIGEEDKGDDMGFVKKIKKWFSEKL